MLKNWNRQLLLLTKRIVTSIARDENAVEVISSEKTYNRNLTMHQDLAHWVFINLTMVYDINTSFGSVCIVNWHRNHGMHLTSEVC